VWVLWGVLALLTLFLASQDYAIRALWPSLVALLVVFTSRSAIVGLAFGGASGVLLLSGGNPAEAIRILVGELFLPIFASEWKLSAILFTLILGGFVALIEASGGLQALLGKILGRNARSPRKMQLTVSGFGLFVFFDGLANTMLVGRLMRSAADRCGVSRVKLAYLADSTGSAVACLAFISTWIAFQLSMIQEGYAIAGESVSAYGMFFKSLPYNFYCWFTLALVLLCALRDFNPGPMGKVEQAARRRGATGNSAVETEGVSGHWASAIIPIGVLVLAIPLLSYLIGADALLPFSLQKFAAAYAVAETHVPLILVASSIVAALVAAGSLWFVRREAPAPLVETGRVFLVGVKDLLGPVGILLAAWILGGSIRELGAGDLLSGLLSDRLPLVLLPLAVFLTGALISFATGTSWGTMAILMPLAIPVIFSLTPGPEFLELRESLVVASIGAVFSGAVFGDHCSPFSDTTIVSSIAAGVEPIDHVRTQMPFALLAAGVAGCVGFVPVGLGLSPWIALGAGALVLVSFSVLFSRHG
jgi:Na+/H+ antiporter NhaC